ncbi:MAG: S8 family serine peptidase [Candidatus Korarchaeota archaeon]|nr:S8 family serine peptidase [Thermoproteota archaeon]
MSRKSRLLRSLCSLLIALLISASFTGLVLAIPSPRNQESSSYESAGEIAIRKPTENIKVYIVVLKKNIPENISSEIHRKISALYENNWREVVLKDGKRVKVQEVRVSKLVKDAEGRYLFKVAEELDTIKRILAPYENYIEEIIFKPVPEPLEKVPLEQDFPKKPILPTNYEVRSLIGVSQAEARYGVTGRGINIAIVDTGVDYGHPDLTTALRYYTGTYKGRSIREPLVFDADQSQVLLLQDVTFYNTTHVYVGGRIYATLIPYPVYVYPVYDYYRVPSWLYGSVDAMRFGVTYMYHPAYGYIVVGVLLIKYKGAAIFGSAFVDVNGNGNFADEPIPPADPYARGSLVRYYYNRVIAPDYDRNGYPDISLGVAGGFFYDWWWWFSYPAEIHPGWDPEGRWLSVFYDFHGHGTACASAAAGRGIVSYNGKKLTGMAPGAGVIGVKALWWGNVEVGMLWAAGFDVDPYTGSFYYTGSRRAHIISNSWGISDIRYDVGGFGYDFESTFITGLSMPGFLAPDYPGILIVQAAGNGGPGYGTITAPGAAPTVLTVGASTSLHMFGQLNFWERDDIISWSARGPTIVGYVKPDVVNVGAHGFTASIVAWNYTLFGGTSYATPLTAGVAALVLEALGGVADPAAVKNIIVSTAASLSHDPVSQGAGRVDAFRAVSLARLLRNQSAATYSYLVTSSSLASAYASKASKIWYWQWSDNIRSYMLYWAGTDLPLRSYELPATFSSRADSNLFFGDIAQGSSASIQVTIHNPTNKTMAVSLSSQRFVLRSSVSIARILILNPDEYMARMRVLITSANVTPAMFLEAIASMPYAALDADNDYSPDTRLRLYVRAWRDFNGNNIIEDNETALINYASEWVNWAYATVRLPHARVNLLSGIVIDVELVRAWDSYSWENRSALVNLTLNYVTVASDPWISMPSSVVVGPKSYKTITLTISAPANAMPTIYTGFVMMYDNVTKVYRPVPYAFNVYTTIGSDFSYLTSGVYNRWPNATWVRSANSWAWRYESGDWRVFFAKPASSGLAWEFEASWTYPDTSLVAYAFGSDGQFAGAYYRQSISWHIYMGGGRFMWSGTGAGSIQNAKRTVIFPAMQYRYYLYPHVKPETGVFTFVVRTILFDGSGGFREPISVKVRVLPAQQLLPATTCSGETGFVKFSLPYIVKYIYSYATRPSTPYLDYDQQYTPGSVTVSPTYVYGPFPAGTLFTFAFIAYHNGAEWQRFDAGVFFYVALPSLPVYYRLYGTYSQVTSTYIFEDWTRVVRR